MTPKNEPRYLSLARELKKEIEKGNLQPGDSLPTFKELRQSAGISQFTYEKAYDILKGEGLAVRTRGRYGGVFVAPRQLAVGEKPIGFFYLGPSEVMHAHYWSLLLDGIRQGATHGGRQVLLVDDIFSFTAWDSISVALLLWWLPQKVSAFRKHAPPNLPIVSLLMDAEGADSILIDDARGAYQATRYLTELGHRRIAFLISQIEANQMLQKRKDGYEQALIDKGIAPQASWVNASYLIKPVSDANYYAFGVNAMKEWLDNGFAETGCTALMAQNDYVALGAMTVLKEAGWRVPEDISIVGYDGTEINPAYLISNLTTMEVPLREIGIAAVNCVLTPSASPRTIMLPIKLRVGETSGPAPNADIDTAAHAQNPQ